MTYAQELREQSLKNRDLKMEKCMQRIMQIIDGAVRNGKLSAKIPLIEDINSKDLDFNDKIINPLRESGFVVGNIDETLILVSW